MSRSKSRAHIINASNYDITTKMPDAAFDMRKLVIPFKHRLTDNAEPFEVLMDKLEHEKAAIVRKLILAYKALKDNHYEFSDSEEGESYDSYVPPTAVSRSTSKSLDFFFAACYVRTENDDDYIFTEDMYADYKEYALDESYAYCFPNYDAFTKAVRAELQLKSGRKRKSSDANPQALLPWHQAKSTGDRRAGGGRLSFRSESTNHPNLKMIFTRWKVIHRAFLMVQKMLLFRSAT
ncbi:MAG: hypothetical protein ACLR1R_13095 [Ruminococcus callidus]